jgi:hypothetical protein
MPRGDLPAAADGKYKVFTTPGGPPLTHKARGPPPRRSSSEMQGSAELRDPALPANRWQSRGVWGATVDGIDSCSNRLTQFARLKGMSL